MAVRTLTRLPFEIVPVNTDWQDLLIPDGFLKSQPGTITIEVTAGSFYFDATAADTQPTDETYSPQYSSSGTVRLIIDVGRKIWFKPAATTDRARIT